jgi:3',5'-cyclic-AMP phosphodiesterase
VNEIVEASGTSRRQAMKCLLWGGAGVLWTLAGGVPRPLRLGGVAEAGEIPGFTFGQISDSHIGFKAGAHPSAEDTLQEAVARMAALRPDFVIHTGDVSHLATAEQFATAAQILQGVKREVFYVPGEHDTIGDDGKLFFQRFGRGPGASASRNPQGHAPGIAGAYSFDAHGVHFVGLVNVVNLTASGLGTIGGPQLEWLQRDLEGRSASTPIVVFAHMPLWSVYPQWGWGTEDAAPALAALRRFGSVTILNGHIHQVIQKVEGNVTYHTAYSTAFPQPAPGVGPGPGPLKVPADQLRTLLGIRRVEFVSDRMTLGDMTLASASTVPSASASRSIIDIHDYSFHPRVLTIARGATVAWINKDDDVHTIKSQDGPAMFQSPALDSGGRFGFTFSHPGVYHYICSIHPYMHGEIVVR